MLFLMLLRVCWSPVLLLRFSFFFSPAPAVHPCPVYLFLLLLYFCCSYILLLSSYCFFCFFCFSCSCVAAVLVVLLLRYCCLSCPASALLLFLLSFSCVTAVPPVLFLRYCCSSCPASTLLLFLLSSSEASNIRVFTSNTETISGLGSMRRVILWFLCIYLSKGLALLQFILLYIFALL